MTKQDANAKTVVGLCFRHLSVTRCPPVPQRAQAVVCQLTHRPYCCCFHNPDGSVAGKESRIIRYGATTFQVCISASKYTAMHCNVCQRPSSNRLQLNCPGCARDVLYQSRILLTHVLQEQEAASSQAGQKLKESRIYDSDGPVRTPSVGHSNRDSLLLHSICAQSSTLEERAREMVGHTQALHSKNFQIRDEITSRTASNLKRRSDLTAAKQKLAQQEALEIAPLVKGIGRLRTRWEILHAKTAQSRLLLCREAASLYGLQRRSKRQSRSKTALYVIGGLPIYHLRDLNGRSTLYLMRLLAS